MRSQASRRAFWVARADRSSGSIAFDVKSTIVSDLLLSCTVVGVEVIAERPDNTKWSNVGGQRGGGSVGSKQSGPTTFEVPIGVSDIGTEYHLLEPAPQIFQTLPTSLGPGIQQTAQ